MTRHVLSLCGAFLLLAAPGSAQALRPVPTERVEPIVRTLPMDLLPSGAAHAEIDRKQIVSAGALVFVPVRFESASTSGERSILQGSAARTKSQCGVFVQDGRDTKFVATLGAEETEAETCNGLLSIGAVHPGKTHGDVILIYDASSPHASPKEPVVLSWAEDEHTYRVNAEQSQRASTMAKGPMTILSARIALAGGRRSTENP